MFPERPLLTTTLLAAALSSACMAQPDAPAVDDPVMDPMNPPPPPPPPSDTIVASAKARVQFIGGRRYRNLLAGALSLPPEQVCRELGQYDCALDVHTITLGGVEPYRLGVREPLDSTGSTTPVAVERMALAACSARADRDFGSPDDAVVFTELALDDGRLAAPEAPSVRAVIDELYRRLLQRSATDDEAAHLVALYRDMAEIGDPSLAEQWAAVSCFAVATTLEAVFY